MKRFHYEREGNRYAVRDRLRGSPHEGYENENRRAVAHCWQVDDAERIVNLLNVAEDAKEIAS